MRATAFISFLSLMATAAFAAPAEESLYERSIESTFLVEREAPSPGATQPQMIAPETLQNRTLRRAKNLKALERVPVIDLTNDDSSDDGGPLAHRSAKVRRLVQALMEAHGGSTDDGSTNDGSTNDGSTNDGSTNDGSTNDGNTDDSTDSDSTDDDSTDDDSINDDMSLAYREVRRLAVHPLVQALKRSINLTDDVPRARSGWECLAVYPTSLTLAFDDPPFTVKDGRWRTNCGRTLSTRIGVIRSIVAVVVRPSNGYLPAFV
ncbi:hypothetical protein NEMBOFW57_009470 [Staphylotrichum longicolle]|uniref:Uncharacterized protein n=1 Tax=Staphylotrichum longicolle TaxID=669026 RepID=A0AAD4EPI9_9PEZI|nr:hypothetical protein NEMBOFW57_009470 [Staphylotrichum longicolle]